MYILLQSCEMVLVRDSITHTLIEWKKRRGALGVVHPIRCRESQRESIGSHVSTVSAVGLVHRAQYRNLSASVSFHTGWNSSQQYPRLQIIDRLLRVDMEAH